jgi:hypothetical protein
MMYNDIQINGRSRAQRLLLSMSTADWISSAWGGGEKGIFLGRRLCVVPWWE